MSETLSQPVTGRTCMDVTDTVSASHSEDIHGCHGHCLSQSQGGHAWMSRTLSQPVTGRTYMDVTALSQPVTGRTCMDVTDTVSASHSEDIHGCHGHCLSQSQGGHIWMSETLSQPVTGRTYMDVTDTVSASHREDMHGCHRHCLSQS